jgi:protease-4
MNVYEKEAMQMRIEKTYTDFVEKVASGRKMTVESVDSIGQGRVWSGLSAMNIGLVDEMGGIKDAIKGAAECANIDSYSLRELPLIEDPYTKLLSQLTGEIKMRFLNKELGESFRLYRELMDIRDLSGIQARLPYFIEIH